MQAQTLIVMLIVLAAAAYVVRLFWRAVRGTRTGVGDAGGCAAGGCGCEASGTAQASSADGEAKLPTSQRR